MIEARGLAKQFDGHTAVAGIDLDVREGECFGLLGPNGAGKTTTLRMLLGLTIPGDCRVADYFSRRTRVRRDRAVHDHARRDADVPVLRRVLSGNDAARSDAASGSVMPLTCAVSAVRPLMTGTPAVGMATHVAVLGLFFGAFLMLARVLARRRFAR